MHEDSEIRRLLGDTASRAAASMPGLLVAARAFAERDWDATPSPPPDPLERRFGPVSLIISRRWMPQPPDAHRLSWLVDDRAMITLSAMAGATTTPTLETYLEQRGSVTQDAYYRIGAAELHHATGLSSWELGETAPQLPERPTRHLRLLRLRRAILVLSVEAAGSIPDSIGQAFAAAYHSIRLDR